MKLKNKNSQGAQGMRIPTLLVIALTVMLTAVHSQTKAQVDPPKYTTPSWWFGAAVGANGNFYRGSTHQLSADFKPPTAFHDGMGFGLYAAPTIEFHKADSRFGAMLQVGYDNRSGKFDQVTTPCNCPADLSATISYLSIEPSLRIAPFKKGLFLYVGPRFALTYQNEFTYEQDINPEFPEQIAQDDVEGEFSAFNNSVISMQIGAGYDIPIVSNNHRTQLVLSPFVAYHPYFGQDPRSIETWNITTFRAGAIVKFGFGKLEDSNDNKSKSDEPTRYTVVPATETVVEDEEDNTSDQVAAGAGAGASTGQASDVKFTVDSPENIPDKRIVKESFPLTNYVFFDLNSTEIPERYVLLTKEQVPTFKEEKVELFTPKNLSGRSDRQMVVYYNILNILGKRMAMYPETTVMLAGSSLDGTADGKLMAEAVKTYLTSTFDIRASRITTKGLDVPKIPSEQPGGTLELVRLREEDRRVTISSTSPELLAEYRSGSTAQLKPVEILAAQTAPVESYVTFKAEGAKQEFSSWDLLIKDDQNRVKTYGPFQTDEVTIPGKIIMGEQQKGNYTATMVGTPKRKGPEVRQEQAVKMVLWTPAETEVARKYSVVYGFNESNAITMYDNYIKQVVAKAIPANGRVIIHGYTDDIGDAENNQALSLARAMDVQKTLKAALAAEGRTDVTTTVKGFGEDTSLALFDNKYPEGRLYNRAVIIEILPK